MVTKGEKVMDGENVQVMGRDDCIQYKCDDEGLLTIEIDTSKELGPSASGKTIMFATSSGNHKIDIGSSMCGERWAYLGLNLYRYPEK